MNRAFNPELYLVTDRDLSRGRSLEEVVMAAVRGGATMVQLREKECSSREFVALARRLKEKLAPLDIPLLINDRVDIAMAAGCNGVHVGQADLPYPDARRLMGPEAIIGLSVENVDQALEAETLDVDYLGLSPVYSTPTKTDIATQLGLEGIRQIREISRHVLIAIGGLDERIAPDVIRCGADGVAVVSAICSAHDPEEAARRIRSAVTGSKGLGHEDL
jgi:thiamine-phosphate pyrophosphorylase